VFWDWDADASLRSPLASPRKLRILAGSEACLNRVLPSNRADVRVSMSNWQAWRVVVASAGV
jgi:hypothetical protein